MGFSTAYFSHSDFFLTAIFSPKFSSKSTMMFTRLTSTVMLLAIGVALLAGCATAKPLANKRTRSKRPTKKMSKVGATKYSRQSPQDGIAFVAKAKSRLMKARLAMLKKIKTVKKPDHFATLNGSSAKDRNGVVIPEDDWVPLIDEAAEKRSPKDQIYQKLLNKAPSSGSSTTRPREQRRKALPPIRSMVGANAANALIQRRKALPTARCRELNQQS